MEIKIIMQKTHTIIYWMQYVHSVKKIFISLARVTANVSGIHAIIKLDARNRAKGCLREKFLLKLNIFVFLNMPFTIEPKNFSLVHPRFCEY